MNWFCKTFKHFESDMNIHEMHSVLFLNHTS